MLKALPLFIGLASALAAQTIREAKLDPRQTVDLPVSREVTTVMFPGPITAVAGADMLIESGKAAVEIEEGTPLRFHVSHAPGSNFILVRSLQPEATARLTAIYEGSAYVLNLRTVAADSVASVIFQPATQATAIRVEAPPEPVKFSPRIGLSLLDRARAYPVLAKSLPKAVEGVTLRAQNRTVTLPDVEVTVQEVYRFSKEDAVVFLLRLKNTTDRIVDLAPSTFAARVANEKFEQSIANGPRSLAPGESAEAEFAVVGMPDGTRNDLSADNAFTVLVNTSRREAVAVAAPTPSPTTEAPKS
ncbi:MAG: type-F conjugative transfer system secretin TraK [Verrucomicrobia bacterium]|nr:type-F conjugative transfer system secretin TraK [Verrucomicrobiota bacterium]